MQPLIHHVEEFLSAWMDSTVRATTLTFLSVVQADA